MNHWEGRARVGRVGVDYVVKIGGSLLRKAAWIRCLLAKLETVKSNVVYTVGSGYLGEAFKRYLVSNGIQQGFSSSVKCWSGIQAVNVRMICDMNPQFVACSSFGEIFRALSSGVCSVIDPNGFYENLRRSTIQTADVRSAVICNYLRCKRLLILTDVNGIYTEDPKKNPNASKIRLIKAKDLVNMGATSVDNGLAERLIEFGITAFVMGIDSVLNAAVDWEELVLKDATMIVP